MSATQDTISAIIVALVLGITIGAVAWELLVAEPFRRKVQIREYRLNDRVRAWQRMTLIAYAQQSRVDTSKALYEALKDNDKHSLKVVQ